MLKSIIVDLPMRVNYCCEPSSEGVERGLAALTAASDRKLARPLVRAEESMTDRQLVDSRGLAQGDQRCVHDVIIEYTVDRSVVYV